MLVTSKVLSFVQVLRSLSSIVKTQSLCPPCTHTVITGMQPQLRELKFWWFWNCLIFSRTADNVFVILHNKQSHTSLWKDTLCLLYKTIYFANIYGKMPEETMPLPIRHAKMWGIQRELPTYIFRMSVLSWFLGNFQVYDIL